MADWLDEAIDAGRIALADEMSGPWPNQPPAEDADVILRYGEAAVRAAAPIIERAVREAIVARIEAEVIAGAQAPEWAQAGGKPTASGIRRWVIGIVRGET